MSGAVNRRTPGLEVSATHLWGKISAVSDTTLDPTTLGPVTTRTATPADAGEILTVQRAAFVAEAQRYGQPDLPPLTETVDEIRDVIATGAAIVLVAEVDRDAGAEHGRRIVGSGRLAVRAGIGHVGRLAVTPDLQGSGIGSQVLSAIHDSGVGVTAFELSTGAESVNTLRWYAGHGYEQVGEAVDAVGVQLAAMGRPQLSLTDGAPRPRVACYVTRKGSSNILVFEHVESPDAGAQLPTGGIKPAETIAAAAMREVFEKTGLDARFKALLGYADAAGEDGSPHRTAYVGLDVDYAPDSWAHTGAGAGAGTGTSFACRWAARDVVLTDLPFR